MSCALIATAVAACVGDDPSDAGGSAVVDAGEIETSTDAGSVADTGGGGADASDAGDASTPPCNLQKAFVAKGLLPGLGDIVVPDLSMDEPVGRARSVT